MQVPTETEDAIEMMREAFDARRTKDPPELMQQKIGAPKRLSCLPDLREDWALVTGRGTVAGALGIVTLRGDQGLEKEILAGLTTLTGQLKARFCSVVAFRILKLGLSNKGGSLQHTPYHRQADS